MPVCVYVRARASRRCSALLPCFRSHFQQSFFAARLSFGTSSNVSFASQHTCAPTHAHTPTYTHTHILHPSTHSHHTYTPVAPFGHDGMGAACVAGRGVETLRCRADPRLLHSQQDTGTCAAAMAMVTM
eukprot:scaffold80909_cov19-Tisochrysis_lutea.AAC.4